MRVVGCAASRSRSAVELLERFAHARLPKRGPTQPVWRALDYGDNDD
jgi:hypothetical protein